MCIAGIALNVHPSIPLLIIHNRDEDAWRSRSGTSAFDIDPFTHVLGASDRTAMPAAVHRALRGLSAPTRREEIDNRLLFNRSWFGLKKLTRCDAQSESVRFAFVTNIRGAPRNGTHSRGLLIPFSLSSQTTEKEYQLLLDRVSPVNLFRGVVAKDQQNRVVCSISYDSNVSMGEGVSTQSLKDGMHVVSNAPLSDYSWPKVRYLKDRMEGELREAIHSCANGEISKETLLSQAASLLCACPNFAKSDMPAGIRCREREVQLQKGVYQPSAARRSRSAPFARQKMRMHTRKAVDDCQPDAHIEMRQNPRFQTTMQTVLCVHNLPEKECEGSGGALCTVWFRETFSPQVHGEWQQWDMRV